MLRAPHSNEMTQGTIFSCATSEDYIDSENYGIVITARCDMEHGKAPIVSYCPIVHFSDWLLQDGVRLVAHRALADAMDKMASAVSSFGMDPIVLSRISLQNIYEVIRADEKNSSKSIGDRFDLAHQEYLNSKRFCDSHFTTTGSLTYLKERQKLCRKICKELLGNKLSDFHFIPEIETEKSSFGYVCNLREIRFLPSILATKLREGIDYIDFQQLCDQYFGLDDKLSIKNENNFAMPISVMQSPHIEFIMQRITQLFSRIGVPDFPSNFSNKLLKHLEAED